MWPHPVQVLMAWGPDTVVISFRGTSSMKGTKMDLCVRACLASAACRRALNCGAYLIAAAGRVLSRP